MAENDIETEVAGSETAAELPDIERVIIPDQYKTKSARIRYLHALGYKPTAIASRMNVIYQHVRNVIKQEPKRGFREVVGEDLEIKTYGSGDDLERDLVDIGLDAQLDRDLAASAKSRAKKRKKEEEEGE